MISRARRDKEELEIAEAMISEIFGRQSVDGHDARDAEELFRHAGERFAEHARAQMRRRECSGRGKRAAEKRERALLEATRTVREVYRKLASALHPDRAPDPAERDRRTRLMQRANAAYGGNDFLALLGLQIEIEQIEPDALSGIPEARIRHYNQVLQELRALREQTEERVEFFRLEFDLGETFLTPKHVDLALDRRIAGAMKFRDRLVQDLESLDDPLRRRALIDSLPAAREAEAPDLDEVDAFLALLEDAPREAAPVAGGRRKKKRRCK